MWTKADNGEGVDLYCILQTYFMDDPLGEKLITYEVQRQLINSNVTKLTEWLLSLLLFYFWRCSGRHIYSVNVYLASTCAYVWTTVLCAGSGARGPCGLLGLKE